MTKPWGIERLDQVAQVVGRGIAPKYADDGDFLVVNQRCIRDGRVSLDIARRHNSRARKVKADKVLSAGDVLVNSTGVGTLGRTAPLRDVQSSITADSHVTILRPLPDVSSRWFAYAVSALEPEIENLAEGSTGQTELSRHRLADLELTVPPLSEQHTIAATLGALDDKIESNRRAISIIDELVRARFEADFDLAQADDGVSVSDLVLINRKQKLSRGTKATYVGMSSLPEFAPEIFDWEIREFGSGQKFVNGDVLMARITPCLENGKTAIVDMLEDGEVGWGSTEYVVLSPKGLINTPWIYALARNELVREWAIRRMAGTSGRQRFQAEGFNDYRITDPDPKSLEEFNSFAEPLFDRMTQLRNEMKRLAALRDVLLPGLLTGRVRVPIEDVAIRVRSMTLIGRSTRYASSSTPLIKSRMTIVPEVV